MSEEWTHYDNLKVSPRAEIEVIKAAWRALSQKWHPDKHPPEMKAKCDRRMHLINHAYKILSDPEARRRYDDLLARERVYASSRQTDEAARRAADEASSREKASHGRDAGRHGSGEDPWDWASRTRQSESSSRRSASGAGDQSSHDAGADGHDWGGLSHYDLLRVGTDVGSAQLADALTMRLQYIECQIASFGEAQGTWARTRAAVIEAGRCLSSSVSRSEYDKLLMRLNPQAWQRAKERNRTTRFDSQPGPTQSVRHGPAAQTIMGSQTQGSTGAAAPWFSERMETWSGWSWLLLSATWVTAVLVVLPSNQPARADPYSGSLPSLYQLVYLMLLAMALVAPVRGERRAWRGRWRGIRSVLAAIPFVAIGTVAAQIGTQIEGKLTVWVIFAMWVTSWAVLSLHEGVRLYERANAGAVPR